MIWPKDDLKSRFSTQKELKWPYFTPKCESLEKLPCIYFLLHHLQPLFFRQCHQLLTKMELYTSDSCRVDTKIGWFARALRWYVSSIWIRNFFLQRIWKLVVLSCTVSTNWFCRQHQKISSLLLGPKEQRKQRCPGLCPWIWSYGRGSQACILLCRSEWIRSLFLRRCEVWLEIDSGFIVHF